MIDGTFLRVFAFEPSRPGLIDTTLRDALFPELCAQDCLIDAFAARHGPGDTGERIVVSAWAPGETWASEADVVVRHHAEYVDGIPGLRVERYPLVLAFRFDRDEPARILRVFHGAVSDGQLKAYIDSVREGSTADGETNPGLSALYLALDGESQFLTVSAWTTWDAIEEATGGNVQQPIRTRHSDRVGILAARHYEILPGTERPIGEVALAAAAG